MEALYVGSGCACVSHQDEVGWFLALFSPLLVDRLRSSTCLILKPNSLTRAADFTASGESSIGSHLGMSYSFAPGWAMLIFPVRKYAGSKLEISEEKLCELALNTTTARCPTVAWNWKRVPFFNRTSLLTAPASWRASSVDRFRPALRSTSLSPSTVAKPARSAKSPS